MAVALPFIAPGAAAATDVAGDLAPRGAPDQQLNAGDVVVMKRLVTGEITPTSEDFRVGDVAPLGSPDGMLDLGDLVVLIRAVTGEITLPPLADENPPAPADATLVEVSDAGGGLVSVAGAAGSVEPNATVTVTNFDTGAISVISAGADGSFNVTISGHVGTVFGVTVTDGAGNESASVSVAADGLLDLTIVAPTEGELVPDETVMVHGTYVGPADAAVTVNGAPACTDGVNFFVNDANLNAGGNEIEVVVSTVDRLSLRKTRAVTSEGSSPVQVHVAPSCSVAGQAISFVFSSTDGVTLQSVSIDYESDGVTDLSNGDPSTEIQHVYSTPGLYTATVTLTDDGGVNHVFARKVLAKAFTTLDGVLRATYDGFLDRLRIGALDGALNHLSPAMHEKYANAFSANRDQLGSIVDQLGSLESGAIGQTMAHYYVLRLEGGQTVAFPVFFILGVDGVWRIGEM